MTRTMQLLQLARHRSCMVLLLCEEKGVSEQLTMNNRITYFARRRLHLGVKKSERKEHIPYGALAAARTIQCMS